MMRNITFIFVFIFLYQSAFSQAEKLFVGKIIVANATSKGVHVINLVNEKEAISDEKGDFTILAKEDDLLVFSAIHLDYFRKIIAFADFNLPVLTITMTSKVNQLDEVEIVNYDKINAVNLGILQKPAKKYTPAERRLQTAGDFKAIHLLSILRGGMSLDPVFNAINGRTKRLKKEIKIETKQLALVALNELFENEFYVNYLKINADSVEKFKWYLIEDENLSPILNTNKSEKISFYMVQKASDFSKL